MLVLVQEIGLYFEITELGVQMAELPLYLKIITLIKKCAYLAYGIILFSKIY